MSAFLNQQLTNVGWDALSTALGGGRLTFFKMQAGSGTIANDSAIPPMTALVAPVCDIAITKYSIEGDGQITIFGNIASAQLDAGFTFRELGVFATIEPPVPGSGGVPAGVNIAPIVPSPSDTVIKSNPIVPNPPVGVPLMYSYCNSYANSDYIPGKGETTDVVNTLQVTIKIDPAAMGNVVINVIAGQQMSVANIGPASVGAGPWSYTQANVAWMKRLVAGAQTLITEDANTITIGARQLTSDLDLYVATGNPDISPNFSTIAKALDYLGQYGIPTTIKARINVSAGMYASPNVINVNHPNGRCITIQGPQTAMQTGTSLSIAGSANAWNMTINGLASTTEFTVNYYAIIHYCGGVTNGHHSLGCGIFKILSKTASTVVLRVPSPKSSLSIIGANSIKITPINVQLISSTKNASTMSIGSNGLALLQYISIIQGIVPDAAIIPLNISGATDMVSVGVADFRVTLNAQTTNMCTGISAGAVRTLCTHCASTNNMVGFIVAGGTLIMNGCASSYNTFRGIWADGGGNFAVYQEPTFVGGNGEMGICIATNSGIGVTAGIPQGYILTEANDMWGIWLVAGGTLNFSNVYCSLYAYDNGLTQTSKYDVVVNNFGLANSNVCITGSRIFNATPGTMRADGGLIN
jgi:hypothetical protein